MQSTIAMRTKARSTGRTYRLLSTTAAASIATTTTTTLPSGSIAIGAFVSVGSKLSILRLALRILGLGTLHVDFAAGNLSLVEKRNSLLRLSFGLVRHKSITEGAGASFNDLNERSRGAIALSHLPVE